jgi:hypothetical protein
MQISPTLSKKIRQAVETSMQIEGYKPSKSPEIKQQAKAIMEQHRVKVPVHRK